MVSDLSPDALSIGASHIRLKRVHSTNTYAADMIAKSKPMEGIVISADFQYEGRGQIGRYWESEDGSNITCSTILRPQFLQVADQFQLNMAISLAIHDFVDHYVEDAQVQIKWPNDIYVGNKKIAGILIQNTLVGKTIDCSIIGTGINVNQVKFSDDTPNPTSLRILSGQEVDIDLAFKWLFRFLTKRYLQLKMGHGDALRREYLSVLYRIHEPCRFVRGEEIFEGVIRGVDDYGRQLIETADGALEAFAFREVGMII